MSACLPAACHYLPAPVVVLPSPQLVAFAHDIVDDDEDFDEHLPFMAVEPRSKQKKTRRGGQRRKLSDEDALEALHSLRNELEVRAAGCGARWGATVWVRRGCSELLLTTAHSVKPPCKSTGAA